MQDATPLHTPMTMRFLNRDGTEAVLTGVMRRRVDGEHEFVPVREGL